MAIQKKDSRLLLNIGLVIFVAILILLVIFEPGLEKDIKEPGLVDIDIEQVNTIRIIHNEETIQLDKQNDKWMVTKPVIAEGNEFKIDSLLNLVKTKSHAHYFTDEIDLTPIRLDKPRSQVFFNNIEVAFGNTQPINYQRYVMVDNVVHLINDYYYHHTISSAENYVSFSLLPADSNIKKIVFPDKSIIEKTDGKWNTKTKLSADDITNLINDWKHAEAIEVKLYTQGKPKRQVTISIDGEAQPVIFFVSKKENDSWLINQSLTLQYQLTQDIAEKLLEPASYAKAVTDK